MSYRAALQGCMRRYDDTLHLERKYNGMDASEPGRLKARTDERAKLKMLRTSEHRACAVIATNRTILRYCTGTSGPSTAGCARRC